MKQINEYISEEFRLRDDTKISKHRIKIEDVIKNASPYIEDTVKYFSKYFCSTLQWKKINDEYVTYGKTQDINDCLVDLKYYGSNTCVSYKHNNNEITRYELYGYHEDNKYIVIELEINNETHKITLKHYFADKLPKPYGWGYWPYLLNEYIVEKITGESI